MRKHPAVMILLVGFGIALTGCSAASPEGQAQQSPSVSVVPQAELDALSQTHLDWQWEMVLMDVPDAVRPEVEMVRYTTDDDWATTMESCMQDAGWFETKATSDGGLETRGIQDEQVGAHSLAMYTCSAKYPNDPMSMLPLTDDRLSDLYDYFVNELKPCLEAEGYEVSEPPSRSQFIDTYLVDGGWNVYEAVAPGSQQSWESINEKCPQIPDGF